MKIDDPDVQDILKKYEDRLNIKRKPVKEYKQDSSFSREYEIFRKEHLKLRGTLYENLCNVFARIVSIKPNKKEEIPLQRAIETIHYEINPTGAVSFATLIGFFFVLIGILLGVKNFIVLGFGIGIFSPLLIMIFGLIIIKPMSKIPIYLADRWRLRASNQMVLSVLYIIMYMRHTSNLENGIRFSAEHIQDPLSLDFRKVFWDVETGKYSTIKESLDNYLFTWRDYNLDFVNSFHLIQSSLFEPSEDRRINLLDKALDTILTGTHDKMMHYAQNLKNPITMLHMLGVVLPILGLVMFPLLGSFLGGSVKWWHLFILYNIILPIMVYYIGNNLLSKRPTGYGQSKIAVKQKDTPFLLGLFLTLGIASLGLFPVVVHLFDPNFDIALGNVFGNFLNYKDTGEGPFGVGALLIGFFVPLGLGFGVGTYYKLKSSKLKKIRDQTIELESEFSGSLFQLGNRIGDGIPTEIAFADVGQTMQGTSTGEFFKKVVVNLENLGMDMENAIFNLQNGAILDYPSPLIESSMEVLIESSRKGPKVAATSLISISNYIAQIRRVNERLKDLLSEIVSSMKSQITFMAPVIAGIVVGIASMVVTVIDQLGNLLTNSGTDSATNLGALSAASQIFIIKDVIPGYYFQLIVGIYVFEIIFVLTVLTSLIEFGSDKLNEQYSLGRNLMKSVSLYVIIAALTVLIFNALAVTILTGLGSDLSI